MKETWKEMADELTKISYRNEMRKVVSKILTPDELDEISKRWKIKQLTKAGKSQVKIADELGVRRKTVRRWS